MNNEMKVLDHGYVKLLSIDDTCRGVSYTPMSSMPVKEKRLSGGMMLIDHLPTDPRTVNVCMELYQPIYVARQYIRCRDSSVADIAPNLEDVGKYWHVPSDTSAYVGLDKATVEWFRSELDNSCKASYTLYLEAISRGVDPKIARMVLHMNHYTHWAWKTDLYTMSYFLNIKLCTKDQPEAKLYAKACADLLCSHLVKMSGMYKERRKAIRTYNNGEQ